MVGALTAAAPTLEDQIRQRWGGYGDWKSAGQDQVSALAGLLRTNGVTDLDKLQLKARDFTIKGGRQMQGGDAQEEVEVADQSGAAFDASYDGQELGFLGNVNHDGSVGKAGARDAGDAAEYGRLNNGNQIGWSSQGGGATSFVVRMNDKGEPVIVPTWESSKAKTLEDVRGLATVAAVGVGGYYAAASGVGGTGAAAAGGSAGTGAAAAGINWATVGTAAAKSAAMNFGVTLARGGSLKDAIKSGATGFVTGGLGGGLSSLGVDPTLAGAATGATGAALRGGDGKDIFIGGATGALSNYAKTEGFTGNSSVDQALVKAGTTLARGGSLKDAALSGGTDLLSTSATSQVRSMANDGGSSQDDGAGIDYDGGSGGPSTDEGSGGDMSYDPNDDLLSFGGALDPNNGIDMSGGFQAGGGDETVDPYGPGSGYGGDTLSKMGVNNDTNQGADNASWFGNFMKSLTGGNGNGGGYLSGGFGRDLMTLFGAGVQSYGIDKVARENREYTEKQNAERRRRQMPTGALPAMQLRVNRGGA